MTKRRLDICPANGLLSVSKMSFSEFGDSSPRMGMEEAQWMVQSWKELKTVCV